MRALLLVLFLLLAPRAFAVEPAERLADPGLEARARAITAELRCLVCQNESVDESGADLAHDIRVLVRDRLKAGDTNAQARQAVVDRYGQFVLLRPRVEPATYVLWFAPVGLLVVGLGATVVWLRARPAAIGAPRPLDDAERIRLDALLREDVAAPIAASSAAASPDAALSAVLAPAVPLPAVPVPAVPAPATRAPVASAPVTPPPDPPAPGVGGPPAESHPALARDGDA